MNKGTTTTAVMMMMIAGALALQGCAHGSLEKRLDDKVAQESAVKSQADLTTEAGQMIEADRGLSAGQRKQLESLRDSVRAENDAIHLESLKLRSILVKDLISTSFDEDEVELIKTRLRKLEDRRLVNLFGAVEKANAILGREAALNQKLVDGFFLDRLGAGEKGDKGEKAESRK